MEQLRELEKRVLDIVQENKKLKETNRELTAKNEQLGNSLMNRDENAKVLETEKASVKTTIEELLSTIKSMEKSS